jgi:putative transposase
MSMRGPQPEAVSLSPPLRGVLERLARRQTSPQRLVRRLQIVLAAAAGRNNDQIARQFRLGRTTVRTWRARWLVAAPRLEAAARAGDDDRLVARLVEDALADAPRPGTPATFSAEQVVQIVALACEPPPGSDRPTSHWTPRELAEEAVNRGIVGSISPRSVERFLGSGRAQAPPEPLLAHAQAGRPDRLRRAGDDRV